MAATLSLGSKKNPKEKKNLLAALFSASGEVGGNEAFNIATHLQKIYVRVRSD